MASRGNKMRLQWSVEAITVLQDTLNSTLLTLEVLFANNGVSCRILFLLRLFFHVNEFSRCNMPVESEGRMIVRTKKIEIFWTCE